MIDKSATFLNNSLTQSMRCFLRRVCLFILPVIPAPLFSRSLTACAFKFLAVPWISVSLGTDIGLEIQ